MRLALSCCKLEINSNQNPTNHLCIFEIVLVLRLCIFSEQEVNQLRFNIPGIKTVAFFYFSGLYKTNLPVTQEEALSWNSSLVSAGCCSSQLCFSISSEGNWSFCIAHHVLSNFASPFEVISTSGSANWLRFGFVFTFSFLFGNTGCSSKSKCYLCKRSQIRCFSKNTF